MDLYDKIQEAAEKVKTSIKIKPTVGVVLGSGLAGFAEQLSGRVAIPYQAIPHFPTSSVSGHAGQLVIGTIGAVNVAVMNGRVHYYEGYSLQEATFPIRVLAGLGVKNLILTNAAGAANPTYEPGDLMLIVDHLNLTGDNPLIGKNDERLGPRFPDMSKAYAVPGRKVLQQAAREVGQSLHEGIYAGLSGPSYETPAEIRMLQRLGADAVGMSTVAEVIVASHAGMNVAALSVITNRAAGLGPGALSHEEVKEVGTRVQGVLSKLLSRAVTLLA